MGKSIQAQGVDLMNFQKSKMSPPKKIITCVEQATDPDPTIGNPIRVYHDPYCQVKLVSFYDNFNLISTYLLIE